MTTRDARYEVSDRGRVRRRDTHRVLRPAKNSRGYMKVALGRRQQVYVHQLVAEAFLGPKPTASCEVDHRDWNRENNNVLNLRWLERLVNCVRWKDRTSDGRNVWSTPDDPPEDEYVPMTEEEQAEVARELQAAGWVA